MKVSGFWALFFVVGTALTLFNFLSPTATGGSWFPASTELRDSDNLPLNFEVQELSLGNPTNLVAAKCGDRTTLTAVSRKLKENASNIRSNNKDDIGNVTLDDYNPIDPVPSSKASIKPGPIEHGTPLMPFIPKPSPPDLPKPGDKATCPYLQEC